jgi:RNA-directed DNA polymerase
MVSALREINPALCIWAMRKYKRFKSRPRAAMAWLRGVALRDGGLLAHWKIPGLVPTVAER